MSFFVLRCGTNGLQRTLCTAAAGLQETEAGATKKTSRDFRSVAIKDVWTGQPVCQLTVL